MHELTGTRASGPMGLWARRAISSWADVVGSCIAHEKVSPKIAPKNGQPACRPACLPADHFLSNFWGVLLEATCDILGAEGNPNGVPVEGILGPIFRDPGYSDFDNPYKENHTFPCAGGPEMASFLDPFQEPVRKRPRTATFSIFGSILGSLRVPGAS